MKQREEIKEKAKMLEFTLCNQNDVRANSSYIET